MKKAQERSGTGGRDARSGTALELLVHGVGGTTPTEMLDDPRTVRITGDHVAAVFRRTEDADAESRPEDYRGRPVPEAYVWCNLTSGNGTRALWLLLLPFMVVNIAHWMRPAAHGRIRTVRLYGLLLRLAGLTLTVLLVAAACEVALDLVAWQCAGTRACAERHSWLGFLSPALSEGGWWSTPGRRLALAAAVPAALTGLLWYLSLRTWRAYESQQPMDREADSEDDPRRAALSRPGFWYGRRLVARLCRRGRSERLIDRTLDEHLVRRLPLAVLLLLVLALLYGGWSRPDWTSDGRLSGNTAFGGIALVQGLLVVALAVVAHLLHRSRPDVRAAIRGLGGPAVAMLACALGGVMSGGVAQRVADWMDGTGTSLDGPPVLLTWQASVIPPLLVVVLLMCAALALHTLRLARAERDAVEGDHPGEAGDPGRTRRIALARAMATLTDRAPLLVAITSAATLLLGAGALVGALTTGEVPGEAARGTYAVAQGAAQTAQDLGSWLIGLGFILFVTWGRRAYKDASARRTIGVLWDVGTFWPRAAHPFAPPCYAERAVPDLTWRMATWTRATGGRLVISGHSQGSVLAAAASWQLEPSARRRVALLTYGSPLERLYGRWFPAHFGPDALASLHEEVDCWRNLYRRTDPIGGPVRLPGDAGPAVDRAPLKDPLTYGRTELHPLPAPILGHSDYQADPVFAEERGRLLARLRPGLPAPRHTGGAAATVPAADGTAGDC